MDKISNTNNDPNVRGEDSGEADESAGEMTWARPAFIAEGATAPFPKNPRAMRKKRYHSASFSHSGINGLTINGLPSDISTLTAALHRIQTNSNRAPYSKNSRKSRNGRRVPSKRSGRDVNRRHDDQDDVPLDHDDPDYDSDANDPVTYEEFSPTISDEKLEQVFTTLVLEFFDHGKTEDVIEGLTGFNLVPHQLRRLPYMAISLALQRKQTQCELTSELLSDMYERVLNRAHLQQGFQLILDELADLVIDVPKAPEYVGRFIARAVADDILPPKFIQLQKSVASRVPLDSPRHVDDAASFASDKPAAYGDASPQPPTSAPPVSEPLPVLTSSAPSSNRGRETSRNHSESSAIPAIVNARDGRLAEAKSLDSSGIGSATSDSSLTSAAALRALSKAESLLTLSHAFARLDSIWGVPVGPRATKLLMKNIQKILKEYFESNDIEEARRRLVELDSPHFHHELVYQAVISAIERSTDEDRTLVVRLLNDLCHSVVITTDQFCLGIRRVYAELPDLQLDVPAAYVLMERFVNAAVDASFMPKKLASELPTKQRKRFVSENDSIHRAAYGSRQL